MATLNLELLKKQVKADDFTEDDEYLEYLLENAEETVILATNREREELMGGLMELPRPLQQAILMLAAHWYNQRESVSAVAMHEVPSSMQALVKPFQKLV